MDSMWFLILGHFLGDYAFQTDRMANRKGRDLRVLAAHVLIYVVTVAVLYYCGFLLTGKHVDSPLLLILACGVMFVVHAVQDFVKARWFSCSRQLYYLDQGVHIIQLFVIRLWLG